MFKSAFNKTITVLVIFYFLLSFFAGIERIVWVNTDYCLIQNDIKINTDNKKWTTDFRCRNGWEIIETSNVFKYRCGMWYPNTVNIIEKKVKE